MTEKVRKYTLHTIAVIFILIGVTASFSHRLFPTKDYRKAELLSERAQLKEYWNNKESNHDNLLRNNSISTENYLKVKTINETQRIADFKKIASKRRELAYDFSFNGRTSLSYWLWMLGVFITLFICSSYLALKDARLQKAGILKWYEPFASMSFIAVSLFWLYHTIFQTTKDFKLSTYTLFLVFILIPLSYFIYQTLRNIKTIEDKFKAVIKNMFQYIFESSEDLKEETKEDHKIKRGKLIRETLDNVK